MSEFTLAIATAFWLGILTSISPCPLATNIAAISFVGRKVGSPGSVFLAGTLYTLGRALTYAVLGAFLVSSLLSAPSISHALQKYMNLVLGPVLILVGMVLLELISFGWGGAGVSNNLQKRVEAMGPWGAGLLGILFALSFCPTSAALFFGSLLPLAIQQDSGILLPLSFGTATGLPVLLFALLIALGANRVAHTYNLIVSFEGWARRITGILFILTGIYFSLTNIFKLNL
jgi:cytochrome c-type biogenesis protein